MRFRWRDAVRLRPVSVVLLVLALAMRLLYLSNTEWYERSHDSPGHLDYIAHIARTHTLPRFDDCWQCYHQPAYYVVAAGLATVMADGAAPGYTKALQQLSLLCFMGFLFAAARVLERIFDDDLSLALALGVLCFLPSSVGHSVRVGNEPMLYLFMALGLLWIARFETRGDPAALLLAAAAAAVSLVTKTNGIILYGVIAVVGAHHLAVRAAPARSIWTVAAAGLILSLGLAANLGHTAWNRGRLTSDNVIVGNMTGTPPPGQRVNATPRDYLVFDVVTFLRHPDGHPEPDPAGGFLTWRESGGRQYYWNLLLRTALNAEWMMVSDRQAAIGRAMSAVALPVFGLALLGMARAHRASAMPVWTLHATVALSLLALGVMRYLKPMNSSNDFRYIYPCLVAAAAFVAVGCSAVPERRRWIPRALVALFLVLCVAFTACFF